MASDKRHWRPFFNARDGPECNGYEPVSPLPVSRCDARYASWDSVFRHINLWC